MHVRGTALSLWTTQKPDRICSSQTADLLQAAARRACQVKIPQAQVSAAQPVPSSFQGWKHISRLGKSEKVSTALSLQDNYLVIKRKANYFLGLLLLFFPSLLLSELEAHPLYVHSWVNIFLGWQTGKQEGDNQPCKMLCKQSCDLLHESFRVACWRVCGRTR